MIGNEEDFTACLGLEVEGVDDNLTELDTGSFQTMIEAAAAEFPNFKVVATTLRAVRSATVNDWAAIAGHATTASPKQRRDPDLEILDRVGGGDSFASGLIYGLIEHGDLAHGGRVRRRPRRARDDHPRRHLDGHPRGGRVTRRRRQRARQPLTAGCAGEHSPFIAGVEPAENCGPRLGRSRFQLPRTSVRLLTD